MMNLKRWMLACIAITAGITAAAQDYTLHSPDGKTTVRISVKDSIQYSLLYNGKPLLQPATISVATTVSPGGNWKVTGTQTSAVTQTLRPVVKQKRTFIEDRYGQLQINFKNHTSLQWRAYNNGIAWRWLINNKGSW